MKLKNGFNKLVLKIISFRILLLLNGHPLKNYASLSKHIIECQSARSKKWFLPEQDWIKTDFKTKKEVFHGLIQCHNLVKVRSVNIALHVSIVSDQNSK